MFPEAPVPVLLESQQTTSAGGAANLAMNLASLGETVELFGAVADDPDGYELLRLISNHDKICLTSAHDLDVTTTKTRLVSQSGQHIMRWDREKSYQGSELLKRLSGSYMRSKFLVLSDYNKGVANQALSVNLKKQKALVKKLRKACGNRCKGIK